ncbi:CgeB family protein [Anaerocolumna xylanovorans]|uniref:Spore protein YkvP/CgeB glycosyl transferase-like domain-containing protein n=1 Tax=Anaerocolumna xylanovorans DSM 12503 TaxID=1121345 RepID=A0A1M7Y8A6_9FIRM|nr:glycosyltransferase [Anaerocolumna xylanovorans]SHO48758.1 protein of unknown function [Anaerocolumna xylanovorans DSM 12503]
MRILFIEWQCFGAMHVVKALEELGHEVERVEFNPNKDNTDESYVREAIKVLSYQYFDIVLSYNFFSAIARACHENGVIYISWLYDSPLFQVWNTTAYYPECYIFSFDQDQCDGLKREGIRNVYYMPLAAETIYIDTITETKEQVDRFKGDVAFVGKLYEKKTDIQRKIYKASPEFFRGYADAIAEAQAQLQSANFLEEVLEPADIQKCILEGLKMDKEEGTIASSVSLYAGYYLAPNVTLRERRNMIKKVSESFALNVFTLSSTKRYKKAVNKGGVDYYKEMPLVFRHSKINLNMTLRSIKTGIPLRCWDIMAAGGFLLTNYQADMLKHFEPGVDFDYFINEEDMLQKIEYYLNHEEERRKIARNGYEKVKKYHGYKMRLQEIFRIVEEGEKSRCVR